MFEDAYAYTWDDKTYTGGVVVFEISGPYENWGTEFKDNLLVELIQCPFIFQNYVDQTGVSIHSFSDDKSNLIYIQPVGSYYDIFFNGTDTKIQIGITQSGHLNYCESLIIYHFNGDDTFAYEYMEFRPYTTDVSGNTYVSLESSLIEHKRYGIISKEGLGVYAGGKYAGTIPPRYPVQATQTSAINFFQWILKNAKRINNDDPYQNVGDEPDEPGQGDFDYTSDDVPIPDLPETDVTDSGLVSLFAPNEDQLQRLAKFLWSDTFSLDSFKKILNNPMDCILGLSKLPVHVPHGTSKEITVGNVVSTVSCDTCKQYLKLNCGTFTFSRSRFTGGYLDNAPYTRCYLYLPFIGTQEINIDEFMGATMGIEYHIDTLTGAMFCFVTRNGKLLLTFAGNCAENVPLSANDFTSTISSMLSMATVGAGAVATIATAGAAAPTTAGMASEALGARTASSLIGAGAQGANAVMNSKPNVSHSGSLGGGAGAMGQLYPYLIFIAPRPDIPTDQNMYTGFPSNDIVQIGNLKDFNVIEAVNLKVEGANDTEMSEIEAILKGGVII